MDANIHTLVIGRAKEIVESAAALSGVRVLAQNEQGLTELIDEEEAKVDGVVLVVCVDSVAKRHTKDATYDVVFSVNATEFIPINRVAPGFVTAIDAALAAAEAIDAAGYGHFETLRHSTPGGGVLNATAECRGVFKLTTSNE